MSDRAPSKRAWRASAGAMLGVMLALGGLGLAGSRGAPGGALPAHRVCVNTAPAERLRLLEGIGPTLSAAIVRDREAHGAFGALEDLDRVPRIGPRTLLKIAPDMVIEP